MPHIAHGTVTALGLGVIVAMWSCAAVLGIEDARCDPSFDADCNGTATIPLFPGAGGNANAAGSAGAAGSASTPAGSAGVAVSNGGATADPPEEPLCARYCRVIAQNCSEDYEQYASEDTCLGVCSKLPPGNDGDTSGNTVQCRLQLAELAERTGEPGNYCFAAGPGGAGICGSDCDGYCDVMSATCSELGDRAACLAACAQVPDLSAPPDSLAFSTAVQAGDSLQCRLFHVSAASVDPAGHCGHAAGLAICR